MTRTICATALLLTCIFGLTFSAQAAEEYQALFNGKDFTGWMSAGGGEPGAGWVIEDGAMVRKEPAGYVWTKQRYGDFVLDLEFKTEGNSGIFFRTDNPRDCVQTGFEIQVNRPASSPGKHSCGALYDAVAPSEEATKEGWNHIVITAKGPKITVELNGTQIIDADLDQWTTANANPDGTKNKFRTALKDFKREGHIGFQEHGANVAYRNVKIKVLESGL